MNMPAKMKAPVSASNTPQDRLILMEKRKKNREVITTGSACQCVDLKSSLQGS